MLTSLSAISAGVSWTEYGVEKAPNKKTIKDVLDWLRNEGAIDLESNDFGTLICLTNWNTYQAIDDDESNDFETLKKRDGNATRTHPKKLKKVEEVEEGEEVKSKKEKTTRCALPPDGVSQSVWDDFLQLRKVKRAPLTETALDTIRREAEKVGFTIEQALTECCARGWQGFKADWVNKGQASLSEADWDYICGEKTK
jgi:hypothetical protein